MKKNNIFLLILFLISTFTTIGQIKKIKFKDNYNHSSTNTVFPRTLLDYNLNEVNAFDKKRENVCVEYKSQNPEDNTKISIYIYPAFSGYEGRLRNEYLNSLKAINSFSKNKKEFKFDHTKIEDDNFIVNGLKTTFIDEENNNSELSIYECGTWFFKIRITSNKLNTSQIDSLEKEIIRKYNPTYFTKLKPLNIKGNVTFARIATRDSLFLASTMGSALEKLIWCQENVSEKERKSGFPDLYLKLHLASINKFIDVEEEKKSFKMTRTELTGKFIDELKLLRSSGFLDEFIMEGYEKIMIVPEDVSLDYVGYNEWRKNNTIPEFLFPTLYQDTYGEN
jgi:hypothetical protein